MQKNHINEQCGTHISSKEKDLFALCKCLEYHYDYSLKELPLRVRYIVGLCALGNEYPAGNEHTAKVTPIKNLF